MGGKSETYSPTPNEWRVKPRIDVGSPISHGILCRGELDTPGQNVDGGDEIDKTTDPTVES